MADAPTSVAFALPRIRFSATEMPERVAALFLALVQALLMVRLWAGDFFNSYAYISDDGFDWITQGIAFTELVTGKDATAWPVLRQPVYVMVSAFDHLLGVPGLGFALAHVAAVGVTAWLIGRYARQKGFRPIAIVVLELAWYFSILGFWRLWVLSDTVVGAFMTASALLTVRAIEADGQGGVATTSARYAPAVILAVLAGLTQTYGMIPLLGICGVYAVGGPLFFKRSLRTSIPPLLAAVATAVLVVGLQRFWAAVIPHQSEPTQFGLLQVSGAMTSFYLNVWIITFGALAPAVLVALMRRVIQRKPPSLEELALLATVAAFALMSYLYQWSESRFTFMYLPIAMLAFIAWCSRPTSSEADPQSEPVAAPMLVVSCAASIIVGLAVVPGDFWRPSLRAAQFNPAKSWIAAAIHDSPLDRYSLQVTCGGMNDFCERAQAQSQSSGYRATMFDEYKRRKLQERKR